MSKIGNGYGSEFHLLRWMGRHRNSFNKAVLFALSRQRESEVVNWIDFNFSKEVSDCYDSELTRLSFIENKSIRENWEWPKSGYQQHWDAIGYINSHYTSEVVEAKDLILVEAKAHLDESNSNCGAGINSRNVISAILRETADFLNVEEYSKRENIWLDKYYQLSNRLATHVYLKKCGQSPHLLFVYFLNDNNPGKKCPTTVDDWMEFLSAQDQEMGISHIYNDHAVCKLFLSVKSDRECWISSGSDTMKLKLNN